MINLGNSGLELYLDDDYGLKSHNKKVIIPEPGVRRMHELNEVFLEEPELVCNDAAYFMYRGIYHDGDREIFEKNNIRYDITVIPPRKIRNEFIKTLGHRHPCAEIYEVLNGKAIYLMQNEEEAISTGVNSSEVMYILRNHDHVTINPSGEVLVMSNIVKSDIESDYGIIKSKKGMSFFFIEEDYEKKFVQNNNYKETRLKIKNPPNFLFMPLYNSFLFNPSFFTNL
ncbi:hypothetical protein HYX19_00975 [Candidatus Woesearchaeota archaeon]|nr:hypothetical protein [Candidatus Woesearchaeota archaeon]